jgi:hypothetical protein
LKLARDGRSLGGVSFNLARPGRSLAWRRRSGRNFEVFHGEDGGDLELNGTGGRVRVEDTVRRYTFTRAGCEVSSVW